MARLSDEEVGLGGATVAPSRRLSDEEVFAATPKTRLSDADVGLSAPGVLDYIPEAGKRFATAVMEGPASSLRGTAALQQMSKTIEGVPTWERILELEKAGVKDSVAQVTREWKERGDPLRSIAETPAYKAGEAVSAATKATLGAPDYERFGQRNIPLDVASGLGSVAGNVLPALVPGGLPIAIAGAVTQGPGEAAQRAVQAKATPQQQLLATGLGTLPGVTEFVDVFLPKIVGAKIGSVGKLLSAVGMGAAVEGVQEGFQQLLQNAIARGVYKPDQELTEDVAYSMLIGSLTGGVAGGALSRFGREKDTGKPGTVEEAYQASVGEYLTPEEQATRAASVGAVERALDTSTLYKGQYTPEQVQDMLTKNQEWVARVENSILDPVGYRTDPETVEDWKEQLPALRQEIAEETKYLDSMMMLGETPVQFSEPAVQVPGEAGIDLSSRMRIPPAQPTQQPLEPPATTPPTTPGTLTVDDGQGGWWGPGVTAPTIPQQPLEPEPSVPTARTPWEQNGYEDGLTGRVDRIPEGRMSVRDSYMKGWRQGEAERTAAVPPEASTPAAPVVPLRPEAPAAIETYVVENSDAPGGEISVQVERGADGRLLRFVPSVGRPYVVPPEYQTGPVNLPLAMKYGPRDKLDQRAVRRTDPTPTLPPTVVDALPPNGRPLPQLPITPSPEGVTPPPETDQELIAAFQDEMNDMVERFGRVQFLNYDMESRTVKASGEMSLKPSTVLSGDDLNVWDLKVPQDQVPTGQVILHDPMLVDSVGGPLTPESTRISMTQYLHSKFGDRGYTYLLEMGNLYHRLREVVKTFTMPMEVDHDARPPSSDYRGLANGAVGITLDSSHRGVSLVVPYDASLLNPFLPIYDRPDQAAYSMIGTMLHEFAHHGHRGEHGLEPVVRTLFIQLADHPEFVKNFTQDVIDVVARHHDIMTHMKEIVRNGDSEPRGKRLQDSSVQVEPGRDVGGPGAAAVGARTWGSRISEWFKAGKARAVRESDPRSGNLTTSRPGDPSFGLNANRRAIRSDVGHPFFPAYQRTGATAPTRSAIGKVFGGNTPPPVQAMAAYADHVSIIHRKGAGLLAFRDANPNHIPLQHYTEGVRLRDTDESRVQDAGQTIGKRWRALSAEDNTTLVDFLNDITLMTYLTPQERAAGIIRHPTQQEFDRLAARHKMNPRTLGIYRDVRHHTEVMLDLHTENAIAEARRTLAGQPTKLVQATNEIMAQRSALKSKPYFPFMRFGNHFITIRNPLTNGVEFHEHYEGKGVKSAERVQKAALAKLKRDPRFQSYPDSAFRVGIMPKDVSPLFGLPPTLLEHMKQKLQLNQNQLDALEQLQYQMSPALSFRHRHQHKSYVEGYSRDFLRAFAHYSFFGARYYANTKWIWYLEEQIKAASKLNGTANARVRDYMGDHLQNTLLDVRGDHGYLKGFAFFMHLAYMPASAFMNTMSLPMNTEPYLRDHFGAVRSTKALTSAITDISTFYRRGTLQRTTEPELRALGYLALTGRVVETQAAELSGLANGNGLLRGIGGTEAQRAMHWFMEKGAFLFENAEQLVRRTAARAAYKLAMKNPTSKAVKEAISLAPIEYHNLVNGVGTGPSRHKFPPQEAAAILYAASVVDRTAFVYKRWAKPPIMRGPVGSNVLVFQHYIHSTMWLLFNGRRSLKFKMLLIMALFGGLQGLPFYEEMKGLIQGVLRRFFGSNVNINTELSRYILQWTNGTVAPDLVLHGMARRGFGVPWLLDSLGSMVTGRPGRAFMEPGPGENVAFPMLDMSKSITPRLSPVDIGKLLDPHQKWESVAAATAQGVGGAAFSPFFNLLKALENKDMAASDPKRWLDALPRMLGASSKALLTYSEERSRVPRGGPAGAKTQLTYDVRDTEQLAEIIFQGMGYTTLRQSREWDFTKAKLEHTHFLKGSRELIMQQYYEAVMSGNKKDMDAVGDDIERYNEKVKGTPDAKYAITGEGLKTSLRNRAMEKTLSDAGLAREKRQIPIIQDLRTIYPKALPGSPGNPIDVQRR